MSKRWLLGVGWVVVVAVGGVVLTAEGHEAPAPVSVSRPPGSSGSPSTPAERPLPAVTGASSGASPTGPASGSSRTPAATRASQPPVPHAQPQTAVMPAASAGNGGGPTTQTVVPRVAGVSYLLDILQKVSTVGPGIANGVAATVLGTALQSLPGGAGATLVAGTSQLAEQLSTQAPQTIEQVRALVAQLSALNPEVDQALTMAAQALRGTSSPLIAPLDQTALQLGDLLSSLTEPPATPPA